MGGHSSELLTLSTEPWIATGREPATKPVTTLLEPFVQSLVLKHSHSMFSLTPLELVWIVSVSYHEKCPNSISLNPWFKSLPFHEILSI